jgi:hypothetical protein
MREEETHPHPPSARGEENWIFHDDLLIDEMEMEQLLLYLVLMTKKGVASKKTSLYFLLPSTMIKSS